MTDHQIQARDLLKCECCGTFFTSLIDDIDRRSPIYCNIRCPVDKALRESPVVPVAPQLGGQGTIVTQTRVFFGHKSVRQALCSKLPSVNVLLTPMHPEQTEKELFDFDERSVALMEFYFLKNTETAERTSVGAFQTITRELSRHPRP